MTGGRIAVIGASGFVGGAIVHHLERTGFAQVVPCIHSTGNAADLARAGRELRIVDLLSPESVATALRDCTHVINCARGDKNAQGRGFQNLLDACKQGGIHRLVHVSSAAVYGDTPPGTISEDCETRASKGTYGANKLAQDEALRTAVAGGLSAVVVCPPNIAGPGSPFLLDIVNTMRAQQFGLVDDGALPCELVDVDNLAHAMTLALDPSVPADGRRMFITDESDACWKDVSNYLAPLAEQQPHFRLDRAESTRLAEREAPAVVSLAGTFRHLLSSDVRDALRKDPFIAQAEALGKRAVRSMPARLQTMVLGKASQRKSRPRPAAPGPGPSVPLLRQQLRNVRYSTERARDVLNYRPIVSFDQSMDRFVHWYQESFGWNTDWWPLLKQLYL